MLPQTAVRLRLLLAIIACCVTASAQNCPTNLTPASLINLRWNALGGASGAIGCPKGGETPIPGHKGSWVTFNHGQIAWSPDQGPSSVIAVYQQDDDFIVNWGDTLPLNYDFFIALVKKDGKPFGQWDIKSYVERTRGFWVVPVNGAGLYTVTIEGCDNGTLSSTCRQSWMNEVSAQYTPLAPFNGNIPTAVFQPANAHYEIDFRAVQPRRADTLAQVQAGESQRNQVISSYNACRLKPLATQSYFKDEEDFVTVAVGKLKLASTSQGEVGCKDVPANYPRLSLRVEVNHALRRQTIQSDSGTSIDGIPLMTRTGEYDIMLRGYITMFYRFGRLLAPDTRYHLTQLLNKRGGDYKGDLTVRDVAPETENHLLQIETSRFLTNQLLFEGSIEDLFGERLDPKTVASFNNATNGIRQFILEWERKLLIEDFKEYNARPYQDYALPAVINLAEFSHDPAIRETANILLNYLAAKYAVSANMGRRNPPYRRRTSHYYDSLLDGESDAAKELFNYYTGEWEQLDLPANAYDPLRLPGRSAGWMSDMLQIAAASSWRPSPFVYTLLLNRNHKPYFQRIHHSGVEIYDAEANFTISSGGFYVDPVSSLLWLGKDDAGPGLQTVLIPYGEGTNIRGMIRIEGLGQVRSGEDKDPTADSGGSSTTDHGRSNTCVAPGFACGIDPAVPPEYLTRLNCWMKIGGWTYVDRASSGCTTNSQPGYYAAVYGQAADGFNFGFFEARLPAPGLSFQSFREAVRINNQTHTWKVGENTYTTSDGRQIVFVIDPPGQNTHTWPIRHTGIPDIDNGLETNIDKWPFVQGDVIALVDGMLTIKDPAQGKALLFNLKDPNNPQEEILPIVQPAH